MKWDLYFLKIAKEVSKNSKCLSRQIGAIIVKDKAIISTGYNGAPRGVPHCNERDKSFFDELFSQEGSEIDYNMYKYDKSICPRRNYSFNSGKGLFMCQAGHAERNAIVQAARNGASTLDTTLYAYCALPCKDCSIEIINAGIKEIVCLEGEDYDKYSRIILQDANIEIKQYAEGLL
jgi:dCMP deaminase